MKLWQKFICIALCVIVILPITACNDNQESAAGERVVPPERQFTFWIRQGDDHYPDYGDNPAVKYLETLPYGTDEKGNGKYIDLSFVVPVSGSEADNFNTLIATGDYMDVMDLTAYSGKALDLYNEGIALDITEYVEDYMPNYRAFLDAHPDLKATATNVIDGEKRFIQIYSYEDDTPEPWGGYEYRRDWIVKYGKNPADGSSFSGAFVTINEDGSPNVDSWQDNVVFPSGGSDPVYISDWEWMFGIFDLALADLGITDGYGMSLYYPGFFGAGDLVCAFGGGNPSWFKTTDNQIVDVSTSDGFRVYLQAMSTWYKNGWIYRAFPEHTADAFYSIDSNKIFQGKIGLWYGFSSQLGGRMANPDDPYLNGYVSFSAAQPINDIYGSENEKFKTPFAMYQGSLEGPSYIVTKSAEEKDLEALFTYIDFLYTEEGGALKTFGLSKDQYEVTRDRFMTELGFTEGAYSKVVEDGKSRYKVHQNVFDSGWDGAIKLLRSPGLNLNSLRSASSYHKNYVTSLKRWTQYENTGWLYGSILGQLSEEDSKTYAKVFTQIYEFQTKNVPAFIKGAKDPFSDEDWNAFVNALNKYGPDRVTIILQSLVDKLYSD